MVYTWKGDGLHRRRQTLCPVLLCFVTDYNFSKRSAKVKLKGHLTSASGVFMGSRTFQKSISVDTCYGGTTEKTKDECEGCGRTPSKASAGM